jgi:hypothetical protein
MAGFRVFEEAPDAACDEAFEAAGGLSLGLAFGDATVRVVLGDRAVALPGDRNERERPVELATTAATEPVTILVLTRGHFDRCGPAEPGECGFAAASARVGPGKVERGGGDVADAALGKELWSGLIEEFFEDAVVGRRSRPRTPEVADAAPTCR